MKKKLLQIISVAALLGCLLLAWLNFRGQISTPVLKLWFLLVSLVYFVAATSYVSRRAWRSGQSQNFGPVVLWSRRLELEAHQRPVMPGRQPAPGISRNYLLPALLLTYYRVLNKSIFGVFNICRNKSLAIKTVKQQERIYSQVRLKE